MKWQKARIVKLSVAGCVGREIWVEVGKPTLNDGDNIVTGTPTNLEPCFETNLIDSANDDFIIAIPAQSVELLPVFADKVPMTPWDEFVAQPAKS